MKIMVTGGAGFIGSALCRYLINNGEDEVINVDKLTYASNLSSVACVADNPRYAFEKADICEQARVQQILADYRPDAIVHLAAESHVDRSIVGSRAFIQSNVVGTYTLLEAVRSYWEKLSQDRRSKFRFLHVSTDEVYGSLGSSGRFTEQSPYDPSSPYSASKAASDHVVSAWYRTYGFPSLISSCSNNYGPFQFPEKLIPRMCINALRGEVLPVYGNGLNIRDWLHVDDHVSALYTILNKGRVGEKYNIGGDSERTNIEVVNSICDHLDKVRPTDRSYREFVKMVDDRPGHDLRYAIDATKLKTELGWVPRRGFDTGLAETVDWYIANPQWWEPPIDKGADMLSRHGRLSEQ